MAEQERLRLGELLVDARLITQAELDEVLAGQEQDGRRLGTLLVEKQLINETELTQILSHQLSVPWVSLLHIEFSRQLLNLVPREIAEEHCLVPIYVRHVRKQGQTLYVAMDDPSNQAALDGVSEFSGLPVRAMIAPPADIRNAIRVYYLGGESTEVADSGPATRRVVDAPPARRSPSSSRRASVRPTPPPAVQLPEAKLPSVAPDEHSIDVDLTSSAPPPVGRIIPAIREGDNADDDGEGDDRPQPQVVPSDIPPPKKGRPHKMVSLTLLDGTSITIPAGGRKRVKEPTLDEQGLTARDLVSALRAVAHGADASEILGENARWEALFATLLSLLLKKHLIADWEFVDEFKKF